VVMDKGVGNGDVVRCVGKLARVSVSPINQGN
jgi:hypothetical protein